MVLLLRLTLQNLCLQGGKDIAGVIVVQRPYQIGDSFVVPTFGETNHKILFQARSDHPLCCLHAYLYCLDQQKLMIVKIAHIS